MSAMDGRRDPAAEPHEEVAVSIEDADDPHDSLPARIDSRAPELSASNAAEHRANRRDGGWRANGC